MEAGTLIVFRGLNSLHRVTPIIGSRTRILVVLAYSNKAGGSLSENALDDIFWDVLVKKAMKKLLKIVAIGLLFKLLYFCSSTRFTKTLFERTTFYSSVNNYFLVSTKTNERSKI